MGVSNTYAGGFPLIQARNSGQIFIQKIGIKKIKVYLFQGRNLRIWKKFTVDIEDGQRGFGAISIKEAHYDRKYDRLLIEITKGSELEYSIVSIEGVKLYRKDNPV